MKTDDDLIRDLVRAFPVGPGHLSRLHGRLAAAAQAEGLLDVAYRTVDTPIGPLLLAATDLGLVRVAYVSEDHDAVLRALGERISPRILHAPARLDTVVRQIEEYFEGGRRSFDVPLDWRQANPARPGSGGVSLRARSPATRTRPRPAPLPWSDNDYLHHQSRPAHCRPGTAPALGPDAGGAAGGPVHGAGRWPSRCC